MSPLTHLPLRWKSTKDQWWYASPIDWACANGHYDLVQELLHIDSNNLIKLTSVRRLHRLESLWEDEGEFRNYVTENRSYVARKLLSDESKALVFNNGLYGGWLIYIAASAGDSGFVRKLLETNPLLVFGEGEYGITDILYAASRSQDSEVFKLIFDFALSPRFSSRKDGELEENIKKESFSDYKREIINRAIHACSRGGNLNSLKELVDNYCSDILAYRDVSGSCVLHSAASKGQVEVIAFLVSSFEIINSVDYQGNTALHVAAHKGQLEAIKALIALSPSLISSRNSAGETFLHKVVSGCSQTYTFRRLDRQIELLKFLVCGQLFDIKDVINCEDNEGRTALHLAMIGNICSDLVQILINAKPINSDGCDKGTMIRSGMGSNYGGSPGTSFVMLDSEVLLCASENMSNNPVGSSPNGSNNEEEKKLGSVFKLQRIKSKNKELSERSKVEKSEPSFRTSSSLRHKFSSVLVISS